MIIYRRTNTLNGKVYIGQCIREGEDPRWPECIISAKAGNGGRLGAAIRRDGPSVFKKENIYKARTQHELDMMEIFFIVIHQSRNPKYGYNTAPGGNGGGVFRTGPSPMKGLSHKQFYGEEKAKDISKKLSDLNKGTKKGVWVTNGIKNQVVPEDKILEGWWRGKTQKKPKPRGPDSPEKIAKRVASNIARWKKKKKACSLETVARLRSLSKKAAEIRWHGRTLQVSLAPVAGEVDQLTKQQQTSL